MYPISNICLWKYEIGDGDWRCDGLMNTCIDIGYRRYVCVTVNVAMKEVVAHSEIVCDVL